MPANINPIFSKSGIIEGGVVLTTAAADWTGQNINNKIIFQSNTANGGYLQRLRFKPVITTGTSTATVARIYINNGISNLASSISAVSGTPTGSASATGGTLLAGSYFAKIQAVDQYGVGTAMSTESAAVTVASGTTNSIAWSWTAVTGALKYRVFVGPATNGQIIYFETVTNSYTQTTATIDPTTDIPLQGNPEDFLLQNFLYGELSLPGVTASATAATIELDYPMNIALPPGYHVVVGLGTTTSGGWQVTAVAGSY